jgi:hypothetical protein
LLLLGTGPARELALQNELGRFHFHLTLRATMNVCAVGQPN